MRPEPIVSTVELQSGEKVGLCAVEVTSIPHLSILQKRFAQTPNIDAEYKQDMARLLSELYQSCKLHGLRADSSSEISLELLFSTEEARNQPYKGHIRLHLIIRAIDQSEHAVVATISSLLRICSAALDFGKYEYEVVSLEKLTSSVAGIDDSCVVALVKEEQIKNLQNQVLPSCYFFRRLPITANDLSRIVNALTDHPNAAISIQLIPTSYSSEEAAAVDRMAQALATLKKGLMGPAGAQLSFSLAEEAADVYQYYSSNKNAALFAFNILVFGSAEAVDTISARVLGQLNIGDEIRLLPLAAEDVRKNENLHPLPWAVHERLLEYGRKPILWNPGDNPQAFLRLPYVITAEEASEVFRLPIGSDSISAGLVVNESSKSRRSYSGDIIGGGDVQIGTLKSSGRDAIGVFLSDLTKHMLIAGTPGSGKTTFAISLVDRLWKEHRVPFLIIEPAKNEYRALIRSIPDLQVFTPGKNDISPFVFNPFVPPTNVKLGAYKSTLKTAFEAAVSMSTPLDKIFEEAVNNCYSNFGWLDTYTSDGKGKTFNISDFIECFQDTFDAIGYSGDARNIGRAGVVRLKSLVNLFDNHFSIPVEDILTRPTLIELSAIENSDQKALLIALLLLSVLAYVNANYLGDGTLRNVIVLEEAHVLLGVEGNPGRDDEANPSRIAQGLLKRMLAEMRSYGLGMIVADQSPRKVTADVVAMTDIKVAFRLVEAGDKQIVADSTNMSEIQRQRLGKLKTGEAFLFFGKLDEPEEISTEDYRLAHNIDITLSDEDIRAASDYWRPRQDKLRPYPECGIHPYCSISCDLGRRLLGREVSRRIFGRHFRADSTDFGIVREVLGRISKLVVDSSAGETVDRGLVSCAKVHLFRQIRYETRIPLPATTVRVSLEKP
jgi:hypothetical protein